MGITEKRLLFERGCQISYIESHCKYDRKNVDDLISSGFRGFGSLASKLFGASSKEVSKMERGFSRVLQEQKEPWWPSLSTKVRRKYEKEADDILKKFAEGYYKGDEDLLNAARQQSKKYLEDVNSTGDIQKAINDIKRQFDNVPRGKIKSNLKRDLSDAEKSLEDGIKSGNKSQIDAAKKLVDKGQKVFTDAKGRPSPFGRYMRYEDDFYSQSSSSGKRFSYSRNGSLGRGLEEGADLKTSVADNIQESGKEGFLKKLKKDMFNGGKDNFDDISKKPPKSYTGERVGLWQGIKKNIKRFIVFGAVVYGGSVIYDLLKSLKQNQATDKIQQSLDSMAKTLMEKGFSDTQVDMNKASFSEAFKIFFSGEEDNLPIDDAEELRTMVKGGSTMTDFFAKTTQLCFEYPQKYFKEKESEFKKNSSFYSFIDKLNEKVGVSKLLKIVSDAEGFASKSIQDTLFVEGKPVSLDEYGYVSYSNPNMKILLGGTEPVNVVDIIDEAKSFVSFFSSFKRKVTNDFIQNEVSSDLKENGMITQEEMEERSRRIEKDLSDQLSKKEEVFVAMVGLILSYNSDKEPFKLFYRFDDDGFSETMSAMASIMGGGADFEPKRQIARMYTAINSEFSDVYREMGKERTLYGVMEFSTFGVIMRSLMNLLALEKICRIILSSETGEFEEEFTKQEIEEYQKVIVQIQKNEGKTPSVIVSGELDKETQDAIGEMQEKMGLPRTGKPGDKTLKAMNDYLLSTVTTKKSSTPLQP